MHDVHVQQQAIKFCLANGWENKPIKTTFLMSKDLTSHYPRYVAQGQEFTNVNQVSPDEAEIFIDTSNENDLGNVTASQGLTLFRRFEERGSYGEIYVRSGL